MSALRITLPIGQCLPKNNLARSKEFLRSQTVTLQRLSAISSKVNMMDYKRPKPFPYEKKPFTWWNHLYDKTSPRLNDNSKIIVVDGPIAAGKSTLAKQLAEDLDMLYIPEANLDNFYINQYGHDLRQINKHVPERCQLIDVKHFYRDPHHVNVPFMQIHMLHERFRQYFKAMAHILNTGQGVILERSVLSDFVFTEAMSEAGYMTPLMKNVYYEVLDNMKNFIMRPHVILYLDVPVEVAKKRIKDRNIEWELNTPVLSDKYLRSMERAYKLNFLRNICSHAEVLIYDWTNFGDAEVLVEDLERIDFEKIKKFENKFRDWDVPYEQDWMELRMRYTNDCESILGDCRPVHFIPELFLYGEDVDKLREAVDKVPGEQYAPGFNPDQGDKVLFKIKN